MKGNNNNNKCSLAASCLHYFVLLQSLHPFLLCLLFCFWWSCSAAVSAAAAAAAVSEAVSEAVAVFVSLFLLCSAPFHFFASQQQQEVLSYCFLLALHCCNRFILSYSVCCFVFDEIVPPSQSQQQSQQSSCQCFSFDNDQDNDNDNTNNHTHCILYFH